MFFLKSLFLCILRRGKADQKSGKEALEIAGEKKAGIDEKSVNLAGKLP